MTQVNLGKRSIKPPNASHASDKTRERWCDASPFGRTRPNRQPRSIYKGLCSCVTNRAGAQTCHGVPIDVACHEIDPKVQNERHHNVQGSTLTAETQLRRIMLVPHWQTSSLFLIFLSGRQDNNKQERSESNTQRFDCHLVLTSLSGHS